jgi:hypothetical protein
MSLDKKSLKAHLLAQYASQLDEMLDKMEEGQALHLTEIEDMALKLRQEVGKDVTETLAVNEGNQHLVDVSCPECHHLMRSKGRKKKWFKTRSGDVQIERPYYYCNDCRKGHFPPR